MRLKELFTDKAAFVIDHNAQVVIVINDENLLYKLPYWAGKCMILHEMNLPFLRIYFRYFNINVKVRKRKYLFVGMCEKGTNVSSHNKLVD